LEGSKRVSMSSYEVIFILHPELEEEKLGEIIEKFKTLIESFDGEVNKTERWGKRRLAYKIKHIAEGFYVIIQFKATGKVVQELDRVLKITDGVLRHMIINLAA